MRIVGHFLKLIHNGRTCWGSCVMRTGQRFSHLQAEVKEKDEYSHILYIDGLRLTVRLM